MQNIEISKFDMQNLEVSRFGKPLAFLSDTLFFLHVVVFVRVCYLGCFDMENRKLSYAEVVKCNLDGVAC